MPFPIIATLILFLTLCAAADLRTRRIPNLVSGPAIVAGMALNGLYFGIDGLGASVAGLVTATAILLAPFALGGLGGGDVKMMGAVGALLGPRLALWGTAFGMVLGGLVMLCHLARCGRLREKLARTGTMFAAAAVTRSLSPLRASAADPGAIALPYSVPLGLGTLAVVALRGTGRLCP
jgi:prepilin peptidase CpaA